MGNCLLMELLFPSSIIHIGYGESYFDRKCNYSLNVQVSLKPLGLLKNLLILYSFQIVSLPNLWIVDFSYGHTGNAHDSMAWNDTQLAQENDTIINDGECVWADSAYPVGLYSKLLISNLMRTCRWIPG